MHKFNDANFEALTTSGKPVLIDFGATWCGPCKKLEPIIEELATELGEQAVVGKVDIAESPAIAQKFAVMGVPTVVFLKDGQPVHQFTGLQSKEKIGALIGEHLGLQV